MMVVHLCEYESGLRYSFIVTKQYDLKVSAVARSDKITLVIIVVGSWSAVFFKNGSKDFIAFLHEGSVQYWPESYTAVCPKKFRVINYS